MVLRRLAGGLIKGHLQCLTRGADWNSLDFAKRQNIPFVTGYHELRVTGNGSGKDGVVLGVRRTPWNRHVVDDDRA